MKHYFKIFKENKNVLRFCGLLIALLVLFNYLEINFFVKSGTHQLIIDFLGNSSTAILQAVGFDYHYSQSEIFDGGTALLTIGATCDGLSFMTLFISFVLAYPAQKPLRKVLFLFAGILVIQVLNTIRVVLLILNFQFSYSTFDFNHKYTFIVIVYGIVLWMWMIWAKKNAIKN